MVHRCFLLFSGYVYLQGTTQDIQGPRLRLAVHPQGPTFRVNCILILGSRRCGASDV